MKKNLLSLFSLVLISVLPVAMMAAADKKPDKQQDKKIDTDKFIQKWVEVLNENRIDDAIVEVKINELEKKLKTMVPPGFPMPKANVYWKTPDKVLYKLLLPKVEPQLELLLQNSGVDEELKKIAKEGNIEALLRNLMKKVVTREELDKVLKFKDAEGKNIRKLQAYTTKNGYKFIVLDPGAKSYKVNGYQLDLDKEFRITKVEKFKDSACYEKGTIGWSKAAAGEKMINFPQKILYQKPDKNNIMIDYDIEFLNPKLNTGLKDELFNKEN